MIDEVERAGLHITLFQEPTAAETERSLSP